MANPYFDIDISMYGDRELQKNLDKFSEALQKKIVNRALRKGADHLKQIAAGIVPADTGALRQSLEVRAFTRRHQYARGAQLKGYVVEPGTREELGIAADDKYYYPAVLEYGALDGEYRQPRPFLRPAYDHGKAGADRIIVREIRAGIARIAKRLASTVTGGAGDRLRAFGESLLR